MIVRRKLFTFGNSGDGLPLDNGGELAPVTIAYETYGRLDRDRRNAVLVCHALTGDAHAAGRHHESDRRPGWWDFMIGPGKPLDTERFFVICSNVIGGCQGSTGPSSVDPRTGRPYGSAFPRVTIGDMVRAQARLIDHLGIERLLAVVGGSMGGMQVLQWAVDFPERVAAAIPIATAARHSAQQIAFNAVGRAAIMSDPDFRGGDYYGAGKGPANGLKIARMAAFVTYMSEAKLNAKFGNAVGNGKDGEEGGDFEVANYLQYHGRKLVARFDANSYIVVTRAIDTFDLAAGRGSLVDAFRGASASFLVLSFSTDWLYPTSQSNEIRSALVKAGRKVASLEIETIHGHDAFLIEKEPDGRVNPMLDVVRDYLARAARDEGV